MAEITLEAARQKAELRLRSLEAHSGPLALLESETRHSPKGWLFFYNSAEFVASGNFIDSLAGNGPLLVRPDGVVEDLGSATDWETAWTQAAAI